MSQNYRALTRTYRPQTFDDIVSQEHVSNTLKNAISQNRLSHAYMFCGPRGVGKTTMARVLARTINSIGADIDGEALNQTMNVVEIDAASNNKVDDIHHLRETVRVPPQNGRYKVFIIDEVHMLSKQAFNALLKTLEEPPEHAIFIFATTEPHKVLPTILSRVQRFDFKRISVDEIVGRLQAICKKEGIFVDDESTHVIAKKADGALRDALGLMDQAIAFCGTNIKYEELLQALNVVGNDQLFELTDIIQKRDANGGLELVNRLIRDGVDIQEFLVSLTEHLRNLYVAKSSGRMHMVDATESTKMRYRESSEGFTNEDLMRMLHLVSESQIKIRDVQQPRVHFEILLLKLVHMSRTKDLNTLMQQLEEVKKNGASQITEPEADVNSVESESPVEEKVKNHSETEKIAPKSEISEPESPQVRDEQPSEESSYRQNGESGDTEKPQSRETPTEPGSASGEKPSAADGESQGSSSPDKSTENIGEDAEQKSENDYVMVKPALGFAKGISTDVSQTTSVNTEAEESEEQPEPVSLSSVDDVEKHWETFLVKVRDNAPRMLFFQMQRLQLIDLDGLDLTVSAENEFALNLLTENQQLLSTLMKKVTGTYIRFNGVVERNEKSDNKMSPFERFKELQRKDPHLKKVVELFGAELEY